MKTTHLTQAQFTAVQDQIDAASHKAFRGTPEQKECFAVAERIWEAAIALPDRTAQNREDRFAAIAKASEIALKGLRSGGLIS